MLDFATGSFLPSSRSGWLGSYQKYVLTPTLTDHLPERYRRAFETQLIGAGGDHAAALPFFGCTSAE